METKERDRVRKICVIGAGTAGLCAIKNSLESNYEVICYEQSTEIGGTWVYRDIVVDDVEDEEEIQSSMYKDLRTNLPKEVMGYPDFPYPQNDDSFVKSEEVLNFLNLYADHFQLREHIKFLHSVIRVRPTINNDGWEVYVRNIKTNQYSPQFFDFIFVCNGHYTVPQYPKIKGIDDFNGKKLHSHLYRKPEDFQDEIVLIIGCGPSGMDIAHHLHKNAKQVFLSHHLKTIPNTSFMTNVIQKSDVKEFTTTGAMFKDGSSENFSVVIFCTGYRYTFPFISIDAGVKVEENSVYPLYKHVININYPTMAFIGIPFLVLPTQTFDLQVRFALKHFSGEKELPSKSEMMEDLETDLAERFESGLRKCQVHQMGEKQFAYYKTLSEMADTENIKPVIQKIMKDCRQKYIYELDSYRHYRYRIIDDENYEKYPSVRG